jgi:diamine N-acetyltransferase
MISFDKYVLRALEPYDIESVYSSENQLASFSNHEQFFSKFTIEQYIENAHRSIYEVGQYRFAISLKDNLEKSIGFVDLSEFDVQHSRVEIGIFLFPEFRKQKIAYNSLLHTLNYIKDHLAINQAYCYIEVDNLASLALFEKLGFKKSGLLTNWRRYKREYKDVFILQKHLND